MSNLISFEMMFFFHSIGVKSWNANNKSLGTVQLYSNGTARGLYVQLIKNCGASVVHTVREARWPRISNAAASYMWYDEAQARVLVLSKRVKGFSSLSQNTTPRDVVSATKSGRGE